jgi:hemolysin activation/secretion protein
MPIFESALLEDQRWLMRNPFRSIELELSPGKNRGETDVIFKVRDQPPIRAYAGYEDTGNRVTGLERTIYGINWYNAAWRDHQFGYQYSASADFNTVGVHSAVYSYARPNRDIVTFFGNFGDVDVPTGGGAFNNKGQFWQTSLRYYRELDPRNLFEHGLQAGFDFKNTNTSLDFGGVAVFASSADIIQGMLGYQAHRFDGRGSTHLALDGYFSPGHLSGRNDNFTYQTINAGADANYVYSRGYLERRTWLPQCWELVGRATGQVASTNLLPPETFGLGGYNSVRGYDQYTFAADTGYFFNLELWTPTFYVFRAADELRLLMFYDIGTGWAHSGIAGLPNNADFQSVGAGFRYQLAPNFQVRADYGFKLQSEVGVPQPDSRFHIGAVVSY